MSAEKYFDRAQVIFEKIQTQEIGHIRQAADFAAASIAGGSLVHLFGSGHSVIPVLDVFPRYGSFAGFHPLLDARLMWTQVLGSGGVRELLKLERTEGYIREFLSNFRFEPSDTLIVYSHGGLNAAPVEVALYGRSIGMKVVAVTSGENARRAKATHSGGKKLADLGDVVIDNCCPPEDSLVDIAGAPVAASSTLAVVAISMALVAETGARLAQRGIKVHPFVSPNVTGAKRDQNLRVFEEHVMKTASRMR